MTEERRSDIDESFKRHTTYKKTKSGHKIDCSKGLWGVIAPTKAEAEREARHYFVQYLADGEYNY